MIDSEEALEAFRLKRSRRPSCLRVVVSVIVIIILVVFSRFERDRDGMGGGAQTGI